MLHILSSWLGMLGCGNFNSIAEKVPKCQKPQQQKVTNELANQDALPPFSKEHNGTNKLGYKVTE